MKLEEFEFVFKTKFYINRENYPASWTRKQIIDAEFDNFYDSPKDYIELLIDEDDYDIQIT